MYITALFYSYWDCYGFEALAVFLSLSFFWHNNCVFTCVNLNLKLKTDILWQLEK